ncbi:MmgE/PrpD family protein [Ruegeria sp. Ofav3-42]|uniref:MmgE/PrpD family protein n=1 Tax=Ruegeria sp. Ofav3-42 TaxID=2917759 RepID=UPI001EF3D938|nr:MmgE/PrpD family protein [Ruegeria sp. Ofav3-42]MCG7519781.1 MmgE/PrpD family protein [Ruegeria sp. Ofav3-42]
MTAIQTLAGFATQAEFADELRSVIAPAVADCFGCILAGADSEVAVRVRAAYARMNTGSAPVFGVDETSNPPIAALMNAVAGHAWDLDDWEEPGNTHPSVVLVPALLAAVHVCATSGQEMATAYLIGTEIIMRLGEAVSLDHYARGFHSTATLGTIGAAGAVARILKLTEDQTAHALSIATSQAVGYTAQFGSNAKPLQAGFTARAGVDAALLAKNGITGQSEVLENQRGFSGLLGLHDADRFKAMQDKLGAPWALAQYGLILKPWPSCGYTHRLMTAALELRHLALDRLQDITAIEATMPDFHLAILPFDKPRSRNEALFSAPACLAQALVTGGLTLADSEDEFWLQADVARLINLTTVTPEPARNPALNYDPDQPDTLRISFSDGSTLKAACTYPLGAPQNPMTTAQIAAKYQSICNRPSHRFHALLDWFDAPDIAKFFEEADQ